MLDCLPLQRAGEGVAVATLYVVRNIEELAQHFGATVALELVVERAILRVLAEGCYLALGMHLVHEPILQPLELPTSIICHTSLCSGR